MTIKPGLGLVTALAALIFATTAEARRGGGGTVEFMDHVAEFSGPMLDNSGAQLSLCHLVEDMHVLYVPLYYTSKGYVLAPNRCDSDSYYDLNEGGLAEAQAQGLLPADIPAEPSINLARRVPTILVGLFFLALIGTFIRQKMNKDKRLAEMGAIPLVAQRVLDVACHAARVDGDTSEAEVAVIADITRQITGTAIEPERVRKMISLSVKSPQAAHFKAFVKGLDASQNEMLIRAALMVIAADGQIAKAEQNFLNQLASAAGITQQRFNEVLAQQQAA